LEDNKKRWETDKNNYNKTKVRLIGDVAISCAFVAYCGAFNSSFRIKLIENHFKKLGNTIGVPYLEELDIISFLVTNDVIGDWLIQGLPNDELSKQNGIIIERSKRFPIIMDPQSKARIWLEKMFRSKAEDATKWITDLNDKHIRTELLDAISSGFPFILENVENEIDPMLDPILDKQ
jgi:dynein heavy chain